MIDESRKPFLRQVWKDHKPQDWHKLVGTLITRQEWSFLCDMWESSKKKPERSIEAYGGNIEASATPEEVLYKGGIRDFIL